MSSRAVGARFAWRSSSRDVPARVRREHEPAYAPRRPGYSIGEDELTATLLLRRELERPQFRDQTAAADEARNCAATDVELVLPTGAEVPLVRPTLAVLPAPRLCDSYNPRPCRPDRAPRPQPAAQAKAKVSRRSPSNRSCIGITGAVDRCERRRPRCRDRPSKRARPGGGTTASALPPARAALSQCHDCDSRADRVAVTVGDPRIVAPVQPTAADRPPRACGVAAP